jgi:hypothetical protein
MAALRDKAINNPVPSSIVAAFLAVIVAAMPMFYQLASLFSTSLRGKFSHLLTNDWKPFFGLWLGFILLASFILAHSQLRKAKQDREYLADKVESTEEKLRTTLEGMQQVNSAIREATESLQGSVVEIGRHVGLLKDGVEKVHEKISRDVQPSVQTTERLTQEAAAAARQALETVRLGTLIRTISQTITSALMTPFFCGSETRTLRESRFLVYVRGGALSGQVTPFYLEPHALTARNGSLSNYDQKTQDLLRIAQCVHAGKGLAWRLSEQETTSLSKVMQVRIGEAATMPVMFDSDLVGVLVLLRPPVPPLFFCTRGEPGGCFGAATDAVANVADEIAPILAQANRELTART